LADHADLRVVAAQEPIDLAERGLPREDRAGDDTWRGVALPERAQRALLEARAEARAEEPRLPHERAPERDHARDGVRARPAELAERDHVLIADVPDRLSAMDGIEQVDVRTREPGGVRPGEGLDARARGTGPDARPCRDAQVRGAVGEPSDGGEATLEVARALLDDPRRIRGEGLGVDGGDEDRARRPPARRHAAERPRAKRRDEPALVEEGEQRLAIERRARLGVRLERHEVLGTE